jgi:hypothetical protein
VLQVFKMAVRDGIALCIKIAESPYIMQALSTECRRDVLIPSIESNREFPGYQRKPAIIFCDNCSCHCSDDILPELANHAIIFNTCPPHTSPLFHVLNVLLSGRLKSVKKCFARHDDLDPHMNHAFRVFRAYEIATMSTTVRIPWAKAGFGSVRRDGADYLWVDKGKIRASPGFVEIWQIDYPEEQLSERRRQQKRGFLNQGLFRIESTDMGPRIDSIQ